MAKKLVVGTSAVHEICLQEDLFTICEDLEKPTAKLGVLADELYSLLKGEIPTSEQICMIASKIDYYHGLLTPKQIQNVIDKCTSYWSKRKEYEKSYNGSKELIILDNRTKETALNCIKAIQQDSNIQSILNPDNLFGDIICKNEQAILLDILVEMPNCKKFKLKLKSKLDNYVINPTMDEIQVNDIKTLGRVISEFSFNIERFSYNRELSFYSFLLTLIAQKYYGLTNPTVKGNYLVVSTIPQYDTCVYSMTKSMFKEGFEEFKYLLKQVAYYTGTLHPEFGVWDL